MGVRANLFMKGMEAFEDVSEKSGKKDYISTYLQEKNYEKVGDHLFRKGDTELINVFQSINTWQYQNERPPYDKGTLVSFIANRMDRPDTPVQCSDPITISAAALIAKAFISEHEKKAQLLAKKSLKSERTIHQSSRRQPKPKR